MPLSPNSSSPLTLLLNTRQQKEDKIGTPQKSEILKAIISFLLYPFSTSYCKRYCYAPAVVHSRSTKLSPHRQHRYTAGGEPPQPCYKPKPSSFSSPTTADNRDEPKFDTQAPHPIWFGRFQFCKTKTVLDFFFSIPLYFSFQSCKSN